MSKNYSVYKHTSPDRKVYIGCTCRDPEARWKSGYYKNKPFLEDIEHYGWENIEHEILASGLAENEAYELEREYIAKYHSTDPRYGYNIATGGKGPYGCIRSEETRRKLREAKLGPNNPKYGKHLSEETRRKISKANTGKHLSEETKQKLREANIGKHHSEETRRKLSEMNNKKVLCVESNITYRSMTQAATENGCDPRRISDACNGKRKTAGGYHWKYI